MNGHIKSGIFALSDLVKVGNPLPPDNPPLIVGDICLVNYEERDAKGWLVTDATAEYVVIADGSDERKYPRACVRRRL